MQLTDEEWTFIAATFLIPTIVSVLAAKVPVVAAWLVDHYILVPAHQAIVTLTASGGGAGLDLARLIFLISCALGVLFLLMRSKSPKENRR